jgi:hypothetical protein
MIQTDLYRNDLYLTLVWQPHQDPAAKAAAFLSRLAKARKRGIEVNEEAIERLEDVSRNVVAALRAEGVLSLLAAGLGGAVLARALAGHFKEAKRALDDPNGRWGESDPVPHRFTAEQLTALVEGAGLRVGAVHGVRIFADLVPGVLVDTEPGALDALLKLEAAAAEQPAFHSVATQLHVLGETPRATEV